MDLPVVNEIPFQRSEGNPGPVAQIRILDDRRHLQRVRFNRAAMYEYGSNSDVVGHLPRV